MSICSLGEQCEVCGGCSNTSMTSSENLPTPYQALPPFPPLEIYPFDTSPFSELFSGLFERVDVDLSRRVDSPTNLEISYDIERFTDIKEFDPAWDDDEVDEIMVISPKTTRRLHTITEDLQEAESTSNAYTPLSQHSKDLGISPLIKAIDISDFEILGTLGHDPIANVTLCRKRDTHRVYTLKSLRSSAQLIWSEQVVLTAINGLHAPFLPWMHWTFEDKECLYMVMDYYPEGNLLGHLTRYGSLPPEHTLFYASEIADGISGLHAAGIFHRDLNPETVMIDAHGHIVLTNFGCAKLVETSDNDQHRRTASGCGNRKYQAPEILLGWTHDFAVDCWGFGILLYYMLFGTHPFAEDDTENPVSLQNKILHDPIRFDSIPLVDLVIQDLILKCLERNPIVRLNIREIKAHDYFTSVNWRRVANKDVRVPCVPKAEVDGGYLHQNDSLKNFIQPQADSRQSLILDEAPFRMQLQHSDNLNESSCTFHATRAIVTSSRLQHVQVLPKIFRTSALEVEGDDESSGMVGNIECPPVSTNPPDAQTIGERKEEPNAKDSATLFWEMLDNDDESNPYGRSLDFRKTLSFPLLPRPRKLRKQPSSQRFSMISTTTISNKLRKKIRLASTPLLSEREVPSLDLPTGIEQIGSGIGFTYNIPVAALSKASICTTTPRSCRGVLHRIFPKLHLGLGRGIRKGKAKRSTAGRGQVFVAYTPDVANREDRQEGPAWTRGIYGSPWSLGMNMSPAFSPTANSPISDAEPFTPETVAFSDSEIAFDFKNKLTHEAKSSDPDSTLRLVSSGLRPPFSYVGST